MISRIIDGIAWEIFLNLLSKLFSYLSHLCSVTDSARRREKKVKTVMRVESCESW